MENVGRLTGGLAHDFNALLGVMTGALDMMLRQADDPARVRRIGQAALAAGQRGELLTRRLTAFSQGDDENLMVGRNGVFYDRKGLDYDATITKIVVNPISLRQAFWQPYKRFVRWVEEQIAKRAAEADAAAAMPCALPCPAC